MQLLRVSGMQLELVQLEKVEGIFVYVCVLCLCVYVCVCVYMCVGVCVYVCVDM